MIIVMKRGKNRREYKTQNSSLYFIENQDPYLYGSKEELQLEWNRSFRLDKTYLYIIIILNNH